MFRLPSVWCLFFVGTIGLLEGQAAGAEPELQVWWTDYGSAYRLAEKEENYFRRHARLFQVEPQSQYPVHYDHVDYFLDPMTLPARANVFDEQPQPNGQRPQPHGSPHSRPARHHLHLVLLVAQTFPVENLGSRHHRVQPPL